MYRYIQGLGTVWVSRVPPKSSTTNVLWLKLSSKPDERFQLLAWNAHLGRWAALTNSYVLFDGMKEIAGPDFMPVESEKDLVYIGTGKGTYKYFIQQDGTPITIESETSLVILNKAAESKYWTYIELELKGETGKPGESPEFRYYNGYLQYKYPSDTEWTNLVNISDLGVTILVGSNANKVTKTGIYYCTGQKTNYPSELNTSSQNFYMFIDNNESSGVINQYIYRGSVNYLRGYSSGGWTEWTKADIGLKQDITDNDLVTKDKTIVGAINEIANTSILSNTVRRIEVVTEPPVASEEGEDNILYFEIPAYEDGIGNMEIEAPRVIVPPFVVR